jgi:tetratricopeptide (TPR) repeat protein
MKRSTAGAVLLVAATLVVTGCAARARAAIALDQARAEALVRDGCYDCLLEAREIYNRAAGGDRRGNRIRALEVELLLVLRAKELAIDPADTMVRAAAVAAEIGPSFDAGPTLKLVEAVAPDAVGTPLVDRRLPSLLAGREGLAAAVQTLAGTAFSPLFRQYLASSVQCGRPPLEPVSGQVAARATQTSAPLLTYRAAICENPIDAKALEQVRAAVPRFAEASLFLGRAAMATLNVTDGSAVRAHLEEAYARFPNSPSITFHLATVSQSKGDCRRAEQFFTATLALQPRHEDARLGRAICHTYLGNGDAAIADATTLIDATAYNRAEGFYWRAWNRRRNQQLEMARADIEGSRALLYNARVLTLAGMIEHDQKDFDKAREDLTRARDMESTECQARWYLGLVGYGTEQWLESARGFADAADCYAGLIAQTERARDAMAAREDVAEDFRKTQITGFNAAIAEDSTQKSAADLNAAINYGRAQDVPNATVYMKRAAVDPDRRVAVEDLRQILGVPRW